MSCTINEKIREKINKLLAMASDQSSPNEAGVAMQMAQKLMIEHGVNSIDLKKAELKTAKIESMFSVTDPKDYENWLAYACAEAFGCHYYWSGGRKGPDWTFGKWWFVGRPDQTALAEHFFIVLQRAMYKGRANIVRVNAKAPAKEKTLLGNGYCKGFATAVRRNLISVEKPDKAVADAVVNATQNVVNTQNSNFDAEGQIAGYADGMKQGLHRPMTSESKAQIGKGA